MTRPGHFEDVTASTGIDHNNNRFSFAPTWCDYNGDGWPDLYVTNDFGRNNLYRNIGGRFRDVAEEAGVVDMGPGMSSAWFDYDGDGRPDLLVSNMWSACGQRIVNDPEFGPVTKNPALRDAYRGHVKGNSLYHNKGDGTFDIRGRSEGIEICPWSWSCDGTDFDNDGTPGDLHRMRHGDEQLARRPDELFLPAGGEQVARRSTGPRPNTRTAGTPSTNWCGRSAVGRGTSRTSSSRGGMGRYYDFSGVSGIDVPRTAARSRSPIWMATATSIIVLKSRLGPQVRVFQNACGATASRSSCRLRGTKSNRDAIGARVEVDGQVKWLSAGSGYLSQHTKVLHFGLGGRDRVEKILIHWPSGKQQAVRPSFPLVIRMRSSRRSPDVKSTALRPRSTWRVRGRARRQRRAIARRPGYGSRCRYPTGGKVRRCWSSTPARTCRVSVFRFRRSTYASADPDLVAAYAIFRRYIFDYRVELSTPFWMLIDDVGRLRKIYAVGAGRRRRLRPTWRR